MIGQHENAVILPFDARNQIERMLTDSGAPNPVGTAAQTMQLLMSWKPVPPTIRVWNNWYDVPQDEPGLRIRDNVGDEAIRLVTGKWAWVLVEDEPQFDATAWTWPDKGVEFPVTEVPAGGAS